MLRLGRHTLYEKYEDIPDYVAADFVSTDPPWNITNIGFDKEGFDNDALAAWLKAHMKQNAWCMAFLPFEVSARWLGTFRHKFTYVCKKRPGMYREAVKRPMMAHELIYAFIRPDLKKMGDLYMDKRALRTKGAPYKGSSRNRRQTEYTKAMGGRMVERKPTDNWGYREGNTVLEYTSPNSHKNPDYTGHPTQKPLGLVRKLVKAYCPPGGIVLDPTLGSGTTLIAAELEGRTCIGAEVNPKYQKMIRDRFNRTLGGWQA